MLKSSDVGLFHEPLLSDQPIHIILFVSRNKDNKQFPGVTQRKQVFLTTYPTDSLKLKILFNDFVNHGKNNETSRMYVSVNARDNKKLKKSLLHYLIENDDVNMANLQALSASLAMNFKLAAEKNRMFDFDVDSKEKVNEFVSDLVQRGASKDHIEIGKTPHGYYVVINRGVDLRGLVDTMPDVSMSNKKDKGPWKWNTDEVTYKKDDFKLVSWKVKAVTYKKDDFKSVSWEIKD